jgi:ADP-glucose pyrophosphorylase
MGRGTRIEDTARVTRSILWDDVAVGRDAVVDECIVTDGVVIPAGAEYRRAVIIRGEDDRLLVSPLFPEP